MPQAADFKDVAGWERVPGSGDGPMKCVPAAKSRPTAGDSGASGSSMWTLLASKQPREVGTDIAWALRVRK